MTHQHGRSLRETTVTLRVGDPDCTASSPPFCDAPHPVAGVCTRDPHTDSLHIAGNGDHITALWDTAHPPTVYQPGEDTYRVTLKETHVRDVTVYATSPTEATDRVLANVEESILASNLRTVDESRIVSVARLMLSAPGSQRQSD